MDDENQVGNPLMYVQKRWMSTDARAIQARLVFKQASCPKMFDVHGRLTSIFSLSEFSLSDRASPFVMRVITGTEYKASTVSM